MTLNMTGKNKGWYGSNCGQIDWVCYHEQSIKTTGKNKELYQVVAKWMQYYPCLFIASYTTYNKTRANTHATVIKLSFGCFFVQFVI